MRIIRLESENIIVQYSLGSDSKLRLLRSEQRAFMGPKR